MLSNLDETAIVWLEGCDCSGEWGGDSTAFNNKDGVNIELTRLNRY